MGLTKHDKYKRLSTIFWKNKYIYITLKKAFFKSKEQNRRKDDLQRMLIGKPSFYLVFLHHIPCNQIHWLDSYKDYVREGKEKKVSKNRISNV